MEHQLFDPASPPEWLDPMWWSETPNCNHLDAPTGAHRGRLRAAAGAVREIVLKDSRIKAVIDLGCGDGALLSLLGPDVWDRASAIGFDVIKDSIDYAFNTRNVHVEQLNAVTEEWRETANLLLWGWSKEIGRTEPWLVVATEMLEHLAEPHAFLRKLSGEAEWIVASSPWGETPDAHEWNHAWCWDEEGYAAMFCAAGWEIVSQQRVEWSQLVTARRINPLSNQRLTS